MRLFVSINLSQSGISQLVKLQNELKAKGVTGYWRQKDNLHLTLRFLGEINQTALPKLHTALLQASGSIGSLDLTVSEIGVFPNLRIPRILWAGIKNEPKLFQLQKNIEQNTLDFGQVENKKYTPHLTLASGGIKGLDPAIVKWGQGFLLEEKITHFSLMNSVVEKGIRKYVELKSYDI
jgi:2'-5' RNA ligase